MRSAQKVGLVASVLAMGVAARAVAQEPTTVGESEADEGVLEGVGVPTSIIDASLYGFIEARFEKVADSPVGEAPDGSVAFESNPHEFDVPAFHVMAQALILERFRAFVNLASPGSGSPLEDATVLVRNAWVETPIVAPYLTLRVGKLYRRFGIYNEQLDAVPYFPGIEPPELFDGDHLMLTRTTNVMLHGQFAFGDSTVSYALMSGNDERAGGQFPLGVDARFELADTFLIGTSFYTSAGNAAPSRGVGDGPPNGGVINWAERDKYFVVGGFTQLTLSGLLVQVEYWRANHNIMRNREAVLQLLDAGLNDAQLRRFGIDGAAPTVDDVNAQATYSVDTAYARVAYEFEAADEDATIPWTITPYGQIDYYSNPETIRSKSFGGDNEAGLADDGQFIKVTAGVILRPITSVAFKIDGSGHLQKVAGKQVFYPEIRLSLAYYWELGL